MKTADQSIGAFEAKNRFSELVAQVGRGAEITITKHDKPVAKIIAATVNDEHTRATATARLRALQKHYSLDGLSVKDLIAEGRR
jgi:prevent-host-death family protein